MRVSPHWRRQVGAHGRSHALAWVLTGLGLTTGLLASPALGAQRSLGAQGARTPVILDTDIGADIDDAFALAMLLRSRSTDLVAVTTVSGDTAARARIAAKMLSVAGRPTIPVAAGPATAGAPFAQAKWADGFHDAALVSIPAVELIHRALVKQHGRAVLIAIGELGNIADLLRQYPGDRAAIKEIVLMGGSLQRGYERGSPATAESNIASNREAAQTVFTSGVPILMAPLDVTAALQLETPERDRIFAQHTPLTTALQQLYTLWAQPTPTLHDPMAVSLLLHSGLCQMKPLDIEIGADGMTSAKSGGKPNAVVAVETDPAAFLHYYESIFTGQ